MQRQRADKQRFEVVRHHKHMSVTEYNGHSIFTTTTEVRKGGSRVTTIYRGREDGETVAVLRGTKVTFHFRGHPGGEQEQLDLIKSTSRMGHRRMFETRAGNMKWKNLNSEWQLFPAQASERAEPLLRIMKPRRKDKIAYDCQNNGTNNLGCCGGTVRVGPQLNGYMELSSQAMSNSPFQLLVVNRGVNGPVQPTEILEKAIVMLAIIGAREADSQAAAAASAGLTKKSSPILAAGAGAGATAIAAGGAGWNTMAAAGAGYDGAGTGMPGGMGF